MFRWLLISMILVAAACSVDKKNENLKGKRIGSTILQPPNESGVFPFPTSASDGYFSIVSVVAEVIPLGTSIVGFSSDTSSLYRTLGTFNSGIITGWQIQSLVAGGSDWVNTCSHSTAGLYQRGLVVDGANFYVVTGTNNSSSSSTRLKKFSKADCSDQGFLDLGEYIVYENNDAFKISLINNLFYFAPTSNPWGFHIYNIQLASTSNLNVDQNYQNASLSAPDATLVTGSEIWAVSRQRLWKLNTSGAIIAWAELPESSYPALVYPTALAMDSEGYLIILTQQGRNVSRFVLDIRRFN